MPRSTAGVKSRRCTSAAGSTWVGSAATVATDTATTVKKMFMLVSISGMVDQVFQSEAVRFVTVCGPVHPRSVDKIDMGR
mmetsp:Transcript_16591/g.48819  ORF Transcript_16591/g.48819 Transcript_16591/m.48819 type:complete len:80 (-) Transcript_16591:304-543(-)